MEYSSFDFGTSSDGFKTDYVSVPDQQHTIDATADFFSFADASGDFEQLDTSATTGHSLQHQHQQHSDHTQKIDTPFHEPQLTPSGRDSSAFTGSSVLTGHNPEYAMSPLQISSRQTTMVNQQEGNVASNGLDSFGDEEEFFSPLESPAIAPTYDRNQSYTHISMQSSIGEATFSPLTSPALHAMPQHFMSGNHGNNFEQQSNNNNSEQSPESILQQKLAMIERQQQQLRSAHWQLQGGVAVTSSGSSSSTSGGAIVSGAVTNATQESMQQIRPITNSPHLTATATNNASSQPFSQPLPRDTGFIAPATPSLLMKLGGGGGTAPNVSGNHSAVDNMASLPAAIIQDKSTIGSSSNTSTKKTAGPKRRKVSRSSAAFTSPGLVPTVHVSPRFPPTDPTIAALVSPAALRPHAPVSSSPRALKPLISPSLQPNGKRLSAIEEQEAVAALATKSNYQNMREGKAKSLGIDFSSSFQSGIENRRSAHKAAEQKRRDTLKQSFDALRKEIADAVTDTEDGNTNNNNNKDDAGSSEDSKEQKEKAVKQMSKVTLIQHAYEYIVRLKNENRRKDDEMAKLREEIQSLKSRLGDQPSTSTSTSTSSSSN